MLKIFFYFSILSLLLINCTKEKEISEVTIEYRLLDDVSPVTAIFTTVQEVGWFQWTVDSTNISYSNKEKFEHTFVEPGSHLVEFNANGLNGEDYYGKVNVEIPEIANKLIVNGFSFENPSSFEIKDDSLNVNLSYNNGNEYTSFNTTVSKTDFEKSDSVSFKNPIIIDIPNIPVVSEDNAFIFITIKGVNSPNYYFRSNFYIKDSYYHERLFAPNFITAINVHINNREKIYVNLDWTN